MTNAVEISRQALPDSPKFDGAALEKVIIQGDLKDLKPTERVAYYRSLCQSLGLNPLTKPFDYISLNGKLVLYAKRECTEQLRRLHNVSVIIASREIIEGCFVVTAQARMPTGRQDESIGAVSIDTLKGEARSNAMMKAETKAKRRVTLSICGLAFLDETETESIRGAYHVPVDDETGVIPELAAAETLEQDVAANPTRETKAAAKTPFNVMGYFGDLKKRYTKIKQEPAYYATLEKFGVKHCNEFGNDEAGMRNARACYKVMTIEVADLEVNAIETDDSTQPPKRLKDHEDWPAEPFASSLGKWIKVKGLVFVRESADADSWKEWIPNA